MFAFGSGFLMARFTPLPLMLRAGPTYESNIDDSRLLYSVVLTFDSLALSALSM